MVFLRSLAVIMLFLMIVLGSFSTLEGSMLNRSIFPASFVFGTAAAAYQYEGGATEGGKGPSIWDTFTHNHPDKITDGSNGDVAVEFYHRYKEDVSIMKNMGMDAYRFSFSWPRILPNGTLSGGVNKEGVAYYNNLINELVSNGLQPFVTLFHWDTPQAIEDQYGSFLSRAIVKDYRDYAETCFREFGDRVKHWITFNEPLEFSVSGYAQDSFPPGRCSSCSKGDSGREPYIVGHHQLLAHAATVKLYRARYQASQKGKIGISLNTQWIMPLSNSKSNGDAAARALDFTYGWFLDPLTQGDYPFSMRALVGDRLPKFTQKQSRELKGSFDFLGINYYTTNYAFSIPFSNIIKKSVFLDSYANTTGVRDGIPIGPVAASRWLYSYPRGLRDLLKYTKDKYNNPIIYITENGVDEINNGTLSLKEALKDDARIEYHRSHLLYLHRAIREGVDVRGYFAWSLLDNFEWTSGFTVRFGLNYVDYKDGLKRYPKSSAIWFRKFLQK